MRIFDNLSRRGVAHNLKWLRQLADGSRLEIVEGDVRDAKAVRHATRDASEIYHLAAQVAVTTSVDDPVTDFETNELGTFNVLEGARLAGSCSTSTPLTAAAKARPTSTSAIMPAFTILTRLSSACHASRARGSSAMKTRDG